MNPDRYTLPLIDDPASLARLFTAMLRIRRVEEEIIRVYSSDKVKSPVHLSIGQESVAVGICDNLQTTDVVYATYRGHAAYLAKGGDMKKMMAELWGKSDGLASGKAGSMHLGDKAAGMIGTSAIVATGIPLAVGNALAMKMRGNDAITTVFFGEGATDEGVFHESMNFAALKKLPILFVCENNQYAIYSHVRERMLDENICERAAAYGIPAKRVEDGDVFDLHSQAAIALGEIKSGGGPQFLECMTYRWRDHVGPGEDRYIEYRPDEELDHWIANDQVARLGAMLETGARQAIETAVEEEVADAIAFAEASPYPEAEVMYQNVVQ
jgi:TPP-dependent pyruvate/acetoin dehydrogenase alpha subunit